MAGAAIYMPNVMAVAATCMPRVVAICMSNVVAMAACPSSGRGGHMYAQCGGRGSLLSSGRGGLVNQVVISFTGMLGPKKD